MTLTATLGAPARAHNNERTFVRGIAPRIPSLRRVTLSGQQLSFRVLPGTERGRLPVVALHGLGSSHEDLLPVAAAAGGPALLVDLPGFGRSRASGDDYGPGHALTSVLALLDHLGLRRPVWLGCSYGGHVALRAALDAPERVARLVLVSSGGLDPAPSPALAAAFDERLMSARSLAQVAASCRLLVGRPCQATQAFVGRRLRDHACGEAGYGAIARSALGALRDQAALRLEQVTAPAELVHGERDPLVPLALVEAAARRLPSARLTVLHGVGHLPWLESPTEVAARVRLATTPT